MTRETAELWLRPTPADPRAPTPARELRLAERQTLATPSVRHGFLAQVLFSTLDLLYGRAGSFSKFVVLELVARVPYQAWENVGYVAISHTAASPRFGRRIFDYVRESRAQQDNEQWHLFILEELASTYEAPRSWLRFRFVPQCLALLYYHLSWLLYVIRPELSYALNAAFEDHAERSYMRFAHEHPELDATPWQSAYTCEYGSYASVADVLRRIALDERAHRAECLSRIDAARFAPISQKSPSFT